MFSSLTDTMFGTTGTGSTGTDVEPTGTKANGLASSPSSIHVPDTSSDDSDSGDEGIGSLQKRFPSLSERDCARFKDTFIKDDGSEEDVLQKLEEYVQFRSMYSLDSPQNKVDSCTDEEDWEWAADTAVKAAKTSRGDLIPGLDGLALEDRAFGMEKPPQLCFAHTNEDGSPVLSKDGIPIIHYLSARLNLSVSEEIHALAIVLYLERKFCQLNQENKGVMLLVDVRKGAGWPNHNVLSVVAFLRPLTNALHKIRPGRMEKFIIYPVPYACVYVFQMMKGWLPMSIAESVTLINGPDGIHDPAPKDELMQYVGEDILDKTEKTRETNFLE